MVTDVMKDPVYLHRFSLITMIDTPAASFLIFIHIDEKSCTDSLAPTFVVRRFLIVHCARINGLLPVV